MRRQRQIAVRQSSQWTVGLVRRDGSAPETLERRLPAVQRSATHRYPNERHRQQRSFGRRIWLTAASLKLPPIPGRGRLVSGASTSNTLVHC